MSSPGQKSWIVRQSKSPFEVSDHEFIKTLICPVISGIIQLFW